jgi:hypothetical protein
VLCNKSFKFYYLPHNKDCVKGKIILCQTEEEEREGLSAIFVEAGPLREEPDSARILLLADEGREDGEIAEALELSKSTANRIRKKYWEDGIRAWRRQKMV